MQLKNIGPRTIELLNKQRTYLQYTIRTKFSPKKLKENYNRY